MTSRSVAIYTATSALAACAPSLTLAAQPERPHFGYLLTKTEVIATVTQTLAACPDPDDPKSLPTITTEWAIKAKPVPDTSAYINVDASSGFLAKRTTALKLRSDGTLESFNSETSGEGAAVIASILKVGASLLLPSVKMSNIMTVTEFGHKPAKIMLQKCNPEVVENFSKIAVFGQQIAALEDKVLKGEATAADVQLLERRKKQRAGAKEMFVLTSDPVKIDLPDTIAAVEIKLTVPPLVYSDWFTSATTESGAFDPTKIVGHAGFQLSVSSGASPFPGDGMTLVTARQLSPRLVYRRAVSAIVAAKPCQSISQDICVTTEDREYAAASVSTEVPVPQFSGLYSLSTGRGGIFGNRQASAKFDAYGSPIEISYGSESGAAGVTSTISAAGDAAKTLRDRELTALERQIKLEEARKKLNDLRTASSPE